MLCKCRVGSVIIVHDQFAYLLIDLINQIGNFLVWCVLRVWEYNRRLRDCKYKMHDAW